MIEIEALAWVHVRGGRMLAVRSRGKDAFYLPGGKREPGETDWQAVSREVREELQVELVAATLAPFGAFRAAAHGFPAGTRAVLTCYTADVVGFPSPAAEIEEMAWLGAADGERCAPASLLVLAALHRQGLVV